MLGISFLVFYLFCFNITSALISMRQTPITLVNGTRLNDTRYNFTTFYSVNGFEWPANEVNDGKWQLDGTVLRVFFTSALTNFRIKNCEMRTDTIFQHNNHTELSNTIGLVWWPEAFNSGCRSYYQVMNMLSQKKDILSKYQFPPVKAVIFATYWDYEDQEALASPEIDPIYDLSSNQDLDMQYVVISQRNYSRLFKLGIDFEYPKPIRLTSNPGPWNDMYENVFRPLAWLLFVANILAIIFGLYILREGLKRKQLGMDLKSTCFMLGFICCLLTPPILIVRSTHPVTIVARNIVGSFTSIAFTLILYIWSLILHLRQDEKVPTGVRIAVYLSLPVLIAVMIFNFLWVTVYLNETFQVINDKVVQIALPLSEIFLIVAFIAYGTQFLRRAKNRVTTPGTRVILIRLSIISAIGFISFFLTFFFWSFTQTTYYKKSPAVYFALRLLYDMIMLSREVALIYILYPRKESRNFNNEEQKDGFLLRGFNKILELLALSKFVGYFKKQPVDLPLGKEESHFVTTVSKKGRLEKDAGSIRTDVSSTPGVEVVVPDDTEDGLNEVNLTSVEKKDSNLYN